MANEGALLVMRDAEGTHEWPLAASGEVVIGRDPECAVHLADRQVSRRHATIRRAGDGWVLEDHGSKNGTWMNGAPVTANEPAGLGDGDEVSIAARYKIFFVDANATAPIVFERRGLRIDRNTLTVYLNGVVLDPPLSGPQYELLALLKDAGGAMVSRDDIVQHVWPDSDSDGVSEDALDALVRRLRLRLGEIDPDHNFILTVRGYGFRLEEP